MKREHLDDNLIQEYLDGRQRLSDEARCHLHECADCREAVEYYRQVYVAAEGAGSPRLSEAFADRVMGRISSLEPKRQPVRVHVPQWLWVGGLTAGAFVVTAAVLGPSTVREIVAPFNNLGNEGLNGLRSGMDKYLSELNLKPVTAVLSVVTLGGIILMDRLLVRVRRTRRFLSLMV